MLVLGHAWAPGLVHPHVINPLTTDDECTRHATLGVCYQLAQSILNIGFALAKKVGGGRISVRGAVHMAAALADCRKALVGTGLAISTQTGVDKAPLLHFWHCRQFSVGRSIHWSEGPDHCRLANEWAWWRS